MRILALETSGWSGEAALLESGAVILHKSLAPQQRSAQSLAPAVSRLLVDAGWAPASVGLVAVCRGPGSFTGLRVGLAFAKTFAYATGASLLGLSTLEVIASQSPPATTRVHVAMDAQRGDLVAAVFEKSNDRWREFEPAQLVASEAWLNQLHSGDVVSGPVLATLAGRVPTGVEILPEPVWTPQATALGHIAWQRYSAGERHDLWSMLPDYFRPSAAQEKRDKST